MGGDPKGGRVCWGGVGSTAIPTAADQSLFVSGEQFSPHATQPAPNETIYLPTYAQAFRTSKFVAGSVTRATAHQALPIRTKVLSPTYLNATVYWTNDSTNAGTVRWQLGHRLTSHNQVLDQPASFVVTNDVKTGQYDVNIFSSSFGFGGSLDAGDFITIDIYREATAPEDTFPDSAWLLGIMYTFRTVLQ